jgi:hypothetical protein
VLLIGEDVKPPRLVQTQGLDPVVNRKVLILHLVQHHRQHDDVVNCRILQQIDLRETPSPLRVLKPKPYGGEAKQERRGMVRLPGAAQRWCRRRGWRRRRR